MTQYEIKYPELPAPYKRISGFSSTGQFQRENLFSSEQMKEYARQTLIANQLNLDWKEAVIDKLVINWAYKKEHEENPHVAIADLVTTEIQYELDPLISTAARELMHRGAEMQQAGINIDGYLQLADFNDGIFFDARTPDEKAHEIKKA